MIWFILGFISNQILNQVIFDKKVGNEKALIGKWIGYYISLRGGK